MVRGENSLFFSTAVDNSGLQSGAADALGIIKGLGGSITKINPFGALAVGALSAFTVIAKGAHKLAKDFEHAMKEVQTISTAAQDDFKGVSSSVFSLSEITPDRPEQLAKAYYQIVSAGYDGAKGMKLLEVAAKAAVAGVTDTQTAADGITTVLNAFKIGAEQSEEVADSLFNTVKLGKTTFSELASSISQVAPIAAASNIPLNEILASVASLTKQGVPTAQAMTQIRAAIVGIQKAGTLDGTKTFQENMQNIYDTFNGNQTAILKEVGSIEAVQAILAVAGKNAKEANKDLLAYNDTIGATETAFKRMASSNINQWQILSNRIKATTEGLGNAVLEMSSGIAGFFNKLLEDSDKVSRGLNEQRIRLLALKSELQETNLREKRREEILKELIRISPDIIGALDLEKTGQQDLLKAIDATNESLINQIVIQKRQEEISGYAGKAADIENKIIDKTLALREKIAKFQDKEKIAIDETLSPLEKAKAIYEGILKANKESADISKALDGSAAGASILFRDAQDIEKLQRESNAIQEQVNNLTKIKEDLKKQFGITDKEIKSDPDPQGGDEGEKAVKTYEEFLADKRAAYEAYENDVKQLGKTRADEINRDLISQQSNYYDFLKAQLNTFRGFKEREQEISKAAAEANLVGFKRDSETKVDVTIRPSVENIEISKNALSKLIRTLEEDIDSGLKGKGKGILYDVSLIAAKQMEDIQRITAIKELKLKKLALYEQDLDKDTFAQRKKEILKEYNDIRETVMEKTNRLLERIPGEILDKALLGTEISFQNLNAATLGQLDKLQEKIKDISLDSAQLLDLGLQKEQVEELVKLFDALKGDKKSKIDTAEAVKIGAVFSEVGNVMSQAGDNISAAVGSMAAQLGNVISLMGDKNANGLQKASGLVGLIIQAGGLMKSLGEGEFYKEVNDQKTINQQLSEQLAIETKINDIRRERAKIERESSAFLDSYYKDDFNAAIQQQLESEKRLKKSMELLSENGIFSAEGTGKRLLFGKKTENRDFSIEQLLGGYNPQEYFWTSDKNAKGRFHDPLSIFGGYSDVKVSKDALKQLRAAFEETLTAMRRTSADMANFSADEWLDFFTIMEEAGHVTEDATVKLLDNAKESLEEYNAAMEDMKSIISDFAGTLGDSLGESLVSAFQDGSDAAENFMKSINDVINQLFLQQLIDTQFRSYFDNLQEEMNKSFGAGGDQSWIDDIKRFSTAVGPQMEAAVEAVKAFNNEMLGSGYDGFSGSRASGMAGAISTITEDTANILSGTLNSIRMDVANGLKVAEDSSRYLMQISENTAYNKLLESIDIKMSRIENIDIKMGNIESSLSQFESQGL